MEKLAPITVRETTDARSFSILSDPIFFKTLFKSFAEEVLDIMLENGLTLFPNRRAVWINLKILKNNILVGSSLEKIGTTFPEYSFGNSCKEICQEKATRTEENPDQICSHEDRDPPNKKFGGSSKLIFELVLSRGDGSDDTTTIIIAPSGLKEWEDLVKGLGILYRMGLITWKNPWAQEILSRADKSVADDPLSRPEGMTITQYAEKVFAAIDKKMKK